ncbi:MAG TPA: UDP-3-O-(3-hydroxymyristoyl)glucosamine N-acyltransferase [Casimicrobiaceae bacterium]|jgi:UDP-3-O-[3-hydroxymyristoyl] glucosamine N-acyltransferase|nr:UDP-3-O-(3-hydroxymyristoyl)glucosamine N-acyltransferase [Casimicrobiaceae bacterium]
MGSPDAVGISLRQLAERCGAELAGDGNVVIDRVATLDSAGEGAIAFLSNPKYRGRLAGTRASAVIVAPGDAQATALPKLVTANPYAAYARVAAILHPPRATAPGVHPTAVVAASARVAASAAIGAHAVIGERTQVGERAAVGAGTVVGEDCTVGDDCLLYPRVVVYPRSAIGPRTIVHSGAVIGADGFGMAEQDGRWLKIPQLGRVVVGADVEIGANTTIDRGAIGDTVIDEDVKLDNQIQVGHNCHIGAHTAIAGCVGIAGSTTIGRNCKIGGAAMISGHLEIADGTVISASTGVFESILSPGVYTGSFPALPHREWKRVAAAARRLRSVFERLRALERAQNDKET